VNIYLNTRKHKVAAAWRWPLTYKI